MDVAYGLAIPRSKLEDYTLPKDAPNQTPPKLHYVLPDRDEIYAKQRFFIKFQKSPHDSSPMAIVLFLLILLYFNFKPNFKKLEMMGKIKN